MTSYRPEIKEKKFWPTAYRFGYLGRVHSGDSINQESAFSNKVGDAPAKGVQASLRHIERREWRLWYFAFFVTILLTVGIASFAFPALLSQSGDAYAFSINQAVRGLVGLVLVFTVT